MPRPCVCGWCRLCWLAENDHRYQIAWGLHGSTKNIRCVHLGDPTGEVRECETCAGRVRLKVRACSVHGTCTEGQPVAGSVFCGTCPDRRTASE
jgi:hypothetical protein